MNQMIAIEQKEIHELDLEKVAKAELEGINAEDLVNYAGGFGYVSKEVKRRAQNKIDQGFYQQQPDLTMNQMIALEQNEIHELDLDQISKANSQADQSKGVGELKIEDLPILMESPWILGSTEATAQQAALRQFERLV